MINSNVQICNPMEIDALMNSVGQGNKIIIVMTFLVRECYGSPKKQEF
jgi:hypothetical protein